MLQARAAEPAIEAALCSHCHQAMPGAKANRSRVGNGSRCIIRNAKPPAACLQARQRFSYPAFVILPMVLRISLAALRADTHFETPTRPFRHPPAPSGGRAPPLLPWCSHATPIRLACPFNVLALREYARRFATDLV